MFYKTKTKKKLSKAPKATKGTRHHHEDYFYRSAIDNALVNNQLGAVEIILDYIVKYQNVYSSSFLFTKNLGSILEKGIKIQSLLNSNIYNFEFDFDEWPEVHNNDEYFLKPFNDSIFELRYNYSTIFPEPELEPLDS